MGLPTPPTAAQPHSDPCRLAISTISLGQSLAGHTLEHRLDMARNYGYQGIEMFLDDIEYIAQMLPPSTAEAEETAVLQPLASHMHQRPPVDDDAVSTVLSPADHRLLRAADVIGDMCCTRGLAVICLQPFRNFEGLLNRAAFRKRLVQLHLWCAVASILGTDLILIPSNFLPGNLLVQVPPPAAAAAAANTTVPRPAVVPTVDGLLAADLRAAADVAAAFTDSLALRWTYGRWRTDYHKPIRLCYEALAWGTHVDTWEHSWDLVRRANRDNLGICLDTFNLAARTYADPTCDSGVRVDGPACLTDSLRCLARNATIDRIFLVQVADGEVLQPPLRPGADGHPLFDSEMPPRMTWSRNCRLFYGETDRGGYLPIREIADVIFCQLGYHGWVSFELFNRRMVDTDGGVPEEMARRGAVSWARMARDLNLNTGQGLAGHGNGNGNGHTHGHNYTHGHGHGHGHEQDHKPYHDVGK